MYLFEPTLGKAASGHGLTFAHRPDGCLILIDFLNAEQSLKSIHGLVFLLDSIATLNNYTGVSRCSTRLACAVEAVWWWLEDLFSNSPGCHCDKQLSHMSSFRAWTWLPKVLSWQSYQIRPPIHDFNLVSFSVARRLSPGVTLDKHFHSSIIDYSINTGAM